MAMSGTVSSSGYEGRRIDLTWTATHDKANNRSLIKWTLKGAGGNSSYYYMAGGFKVTINGTTVYSKSTDYRIQLKVGTVVASGERYVGHDTGGTKTFSIAIEAGIYYYAVNCSGSKSFTLDPITFTVTSTFHKLRFNTTWNHFATKTTTVGYGNKFTPYNTTVPAGYYAGNNFGYYNNDTGAQIGNGTVGTDSITITCNTRVHVHYYPNKYNVDLNGKLDGTTVYAASPMGTADIYINGSLVANDVGDYNTAHYTESTYEVKDIKTNPGYTYTGAASYSGTIGTSAVGIYPTWTTNSYSYNFNVLLPDGSEPWQTGEAGSVEISINGGSWTRIYNEGASSYPYGTTFKFRNFTPGTGLKLNSVTGVTANSDGTWSATMGTSGLNINFSTAYQTYTNRIDHWTWGFTKQEGTNGSKNAYPLGSTYFNQVYGSSYSLNTDRATTIPAGFTLRNKFGTSSISGAWAQYDMGTTTTQAAGTMSYEYDYDPIAYSISYELDGGTNNSSNPTSYNVLYGFTLAEPTKTNNKFLGWYKKNAKINYTLSASSGNYNYYTVRTGIKPGDKYCIKIDSATRTAGTATQFLALFYDFTDQAWRASATVNFGNNLEFWLECPSSTPSGKDIHLIIYAGMAGATANNAVSISGLEIQELSTGISQPANSFANTDAFYTAMNSRAKGNVTFVAKWELLACYVTYNGNGNIVSNIPAKQEKIIGTNITLSSTKPTRGDRYKFLGWAESSSATSATYQPGATFTKDVDTTLYAVWQLLDKDIYLYNTGKIDAVDFKTVSAVTDLFDNNGNVYATQFVTHSESNIYIDKDGKIYAKEFIKY